VAPSFIVDKSALSRMRHASVDERLSPLVLAGEVATCSIIELEALFSARRHSDLVATRKERRAAFVCVPITQGDFDRATDVMEALAKRGHHRSAGIPDLLIAAVAERARLCLLHYDHDFDLITAHTGQEAEWVVPPGSVP
jgi:predicted nucleic acid-binding protein